MSFGDYEYEQDVKRKKALGYVWKNGCLVLPKPSEEKKGFAQRIAEAEEMNKSLVPTPKEEPEKKEEEEKEVIFEIPEEQFDRILSEIAHQGSRTRRMAFRILQRQKQLIRRQKEQIALMNQLIKLSNVVRVSEDNPMLRKKAEHEKIRDYRRDRGRLYALMYHAGYTVKDLAKRGITIDAILSGKQKIPKEFGINYPEKE